MEETLGFEGTIKISLEAQKSRLDASAMPMMKELFHAFHASYLGLYGVILKKGIIHEDPYKYDQKISEVANPPEGPFLESERVDQLSIRLSQFESMLDFLTNYYQFSLDFLNLNRVRHLVGFVKYIHWDSISLTSPNLNTRALAECLEKIKKGSDTLSAGIIADAQTQIERISKQILDILKDVTIYHREAYKLQVRDKVLSNLQLTPESAMTKRQEVLRSVKHQFALQMGDTAFYPELIEEILEENFSPNAEELRTNLIKKLELKEVQSQKTREDVSFKQILLDAIKALGTAGFQMDECIKKLTEDNQILKLRKTTLSERFKNWLIRLIRGEDQAQIYEVEYFDVVTSTTKTELIDFPRFLEETAQKVRLFSAIGIKTSPTFRKLEAAPEDQAFSFLSRNLEETQLIFRRLTALDTYFKSEVGRDERLKLRGIKVELSSIKNSIMKANQKKHEYVAHREEAEQMKKLGINPSQPS